LYQYVDDIAYPRQSAAYHGWQDVEHKARLRKEEKDALIAQSQRDDVPFTISNDDFATTSREPDSDLDDSDDSNNEDNEENQEEEE
jgi:hypothetical protein